MTIRIVDICYYPLKSGKAIHADRAEIIQTGVRNDRQAVLVHADGNDEGKIITQRTKGCEKLALVESRIDEISRLFHFRIPGGRSVSVSLDTGHNRPLDIINLWDNAVKGIDAGDTAAELFSGYLKLNCRVKLYSKHNPRSISPKHASYAQEGDIVSFADKFPLLVTSEPSLRDLNFAATLIAQSKKAQEPNQEITLHEMSAFRPNIVIDGPELKAWAEDFVGRVRIGDVELDLCRPADRCKVTNINQGTANVDDSRALKRLSAYRFGVGGGVEGAIFGALARPVTLGVIKVGDEVEVLSWRPVHEALINMEQWQKEKFYAQYNIAAPAAPN